MSENGLSISDSQDDTIELDPTLMQYLSRTEKLELLSPSNMGTSGDGNVHYSIRDRPYACHVCNKRFIQKAHLIIHKRIHTGEKPYACHICNKRFAQSSHLAVHKRVHTGEKPFFCNFCGMGFCRRPRLEAHVLQHVVKEGRNFPASFKDDSVSSLSMVGIGSTSSFKDRTNQESLDAAAQLMELKMQGGMVPDIKSEPSDAAEGVTSSVIRDANGNHSSGENDGVRKRRKPEFVRRLAGKDTEVDRAMARNTKGVVAVENNCTGDKGNHDYADTNNLLDFSSDDLDRLTLNLTELTDYQRQVLNQSLMLSSSKNHLNSFINISNNNRMHSTPSLMNSGLTMSGLVRTNNRISLVDFTAEDILKHLMTRDDVKSCDFCCIVFHDPAMYYLHRSMHDKMDVRCCNLCGKLLTDKYDFTAHFLSQHK